MDNLQNIIKAYNAKRAYARRCQNLLCQRDYITRDRHSRICYECARKAWNKMIAEREAMDTLIRSNNK